MKADATIVLRQPRAAAGIVQQREEKRMANAKVAVIGAGNVGATTALALAQLNIADIVMTSPAAAS